MQSSAHSPEWGQKAGNVSQLLLQVTPTCRDTEELPWGQSPCATHGQPAELLHTTQCPLLFWEPLWFYFPKLQEEFPAVSCSLAMMIPHFQSSALTPLHSPGIAALTKMAQGGDQQAPSWKTPGMLTGRH